MVTHLIIVQYTTVGLGTEAFVPGTTKKGGQIEKREKTVID